MEVVVQSGRRGSPAAGRGAAVEHGLKHSITSISRNTSMLVGLSEVFPRVANAPPQAQPGKVGRVGQSQPRW